MEAVIATFEGPQWCMVIELWVRFFLIECKETTWWNCCYKLLASE